MKFRTLPAWLALILMPAVYAHAGEPTTQTLQFPMESYQGNFREHCLRLQSGQALELAVRSRYPILLNLHYHEGAETAFLLDDLVDSTREAAVDIPADGEYCFEVSNPETRPSAFEVRLDLRLSSG